MAPPGRVHEHGDGDYAYAPPRLTIHVRSFREPLGSRKRTGPIGSIGGTIILRNSLARDGDSPNQKSHPSLFYIYIYLSHTYSGIDTFQKERGGRGTNKGNHVHM